MIYFIQAGEDGPVKIGYAISRTRLDARLADLQCGNHLPLHIRIVCNGSRSDEIHLHTKLDAFRIRGEWFSRDVLDAIGQYSLYFLLRDSFLREEETEEDVDHERSVDVTLPEDDLDRVSSPRGRPRHADVVGIVTITKRLRIAAGLTQEELAGRLGYSQPLIAQWEAGKKQPSSDQVDLISRVCDISGVREESR